MTEARNL